MKLKYYILFVAKKGSSRESPHLLTLLLPMFVAIHFSAHLGKIVVVFMISILIWHIYNYLSIFSVTFEHTDCTYSTHFYLQDGGGLLSK